MEPQISDETWAYANEFFRQKPEYLWKLSIFQDATQRAEQRGVQQGVQQGVQKTLIRQLRRKFTSIPDSKRRVRPTHLFCLKEYNEFCSLPSSTW